MSLLTKLIYIILFILLIVHPHLITGHVFSFSQAYIQSLITLLIVGTAFIVYVLHVRDIRRSEFDKKQVEGELNISVNKLIDAYKYIGTINRRLPLLNNVTTNLLKYPRYNKRDRKNIIEDLLNTATVSLANVSWGIFRFVDVMSKKTIKEFVCTTNSYVLLRTKISNDKLIQLLGQQKQISRMAGLNVLSTSDNQASIQCFFIFPKSGTSIEMELSTLQAIVDQTQLFYQYLNMK